MDIRNTVAGVYCKSQGKTNLTTKPSAKFWLLIDCESGPEASDFENYFEEEEDRTQKQQKQQASAEIKTQAATSS